MATAEEALQLADGTRKILLLSFPDREIGELVRMGVRIPVSDEREERILREFPGAKIHVAFDCGMNRIGFKDPDEALACLMRTGAEGLYTHVYSEEPRTFARAVAKFSRLADAAKRRKNSLICHVGGSGISGSGPRFDMVRAGIELFRNAAVLRARVVAVKHVCQGETIGYGERISERDRDIAVFSCGYADGFRRGLSERISVTVGGVRCPVIGKICMDLSFADVTGVRVRPGEEVTVLDDFEGAAGLLDTIDYEMMTGISGRVERIYS